MSFKAKSANILSIILIVVAVLALAVFGIGGTIYALTALEHYNRVYETPLTVKATVTEYDDYDDEGDTDYRSYVSYFVDGVQYDHIQFEDKDGKDQLTPLGTVVDLQVSPENPAKTISDLRSDGMFLLFTILPIGFFPAAIWRTLIHGRRNKHLLSVPDTETVEKDARLTILGRFSLLLWPTLAAGYGAAALRYPAVFGTVVRIIVAACAIIWLWCVILAIRDRRLIAHGEYELRRDTLIYKRIDEDSDSISYELTYRTADREWTSSTSRHLYDLATVGDTITSVYLPKRKKPLLHYDRFGNTH